MLSVTIRHQSTRPHARLFKVIGSPVALHALVWIMLQAGAIAWFHRPSLPDAPVPGNVLPGAYFTLTNLLHIGLFYLVAYGLFPRLFTTRTWWLYLLSMAGLVGTVYYLKLGLIEWFFPRVTVTDDNWQFVFFPTLFFLIAGTIFRLGVNHFRREREQQQRQAEQLASELRFLRSQVNPHFLFNVLNLMVALARKKSDRLEPALIKLSGLMRYMLYESAQASVSLDREVAYLTDYIDLQQLRFGTTVGVQTEITLPEKPFIIEPMLLIPFVENAFKHGVAYITDPFVHIRLWMKDTTLHLRVENRYNSNRQEPKDQQPGIGLANVRKRLPLLYPDRHQLRITDEEGVYQVHLSLELASTPVLPKPKLSF